MENNSFEQKVRSIDWAKYSAPEYYDSEMMFYDPARPVKALIKLSQFDSYDSAKANDLSSEILFAFGNDHRGTYYPAALEAIDLLIEIEKLANNEKAQNFDKVTLNNLYYFQLEMPKSNQDLYDLIDNSIREKLSPYSDENWDDN